MEKKLDDIVDYIIKTKQRIAILGENGTGKSHVLEKILNKNVESFGSNFYVDLEANYNKKNKLKKTSFLEMFDIQMRKMWANDYSPSSYFGVQFSQKWGLDVNFDEETPDFIYSFELYFLVKNEQTINNAEELVNVRSLMSEDTLLNKGINFSDLLKLIEFCFSLYITLFDRPLSVIKTTLSNFKFDESPELEFYASELLNFVNSHEYLNNDSSNLFIINKTEDEELYNGEYDRYIKIKGTITGIEKTDQFDKKSKKWIKNLFTKRIPNSGSGTSWYHTLKIYVLLIKLIDELAKSSLPFMTIKTSLLLDEPEIGLHESFKFDLGRILSKSVHSKNGSTFSIVIATHSKTLAKAFVKDVTEVVVSSKKGRDLSDQSYVFKVYDESEHKDISEKFASLNISKFDANMKKRYEKLKNSKFIDVFEKNYNERKLAVYSGFFNKNVIFCEGLNDSTFINLLIEKSAQRDTVVIPIWGKDYAIPYWSIFKDLFQNLYLVVDSDSEDEKNQWYQVNQILKAENAIFIDGTIEKTFANVMNELNDKNERMTYRFDKDQLAELFEKFHEGDISKEDSEMIDFMKALVIVYKKISRFFEKRILISDNELRQLIDSKLAKEW